MIAGAQGFILFYELSHRGETFLEVQGVVVSGGKRHPKLEPQIWPFEHKIRRCGEYFKRQFCRQLQLRNPSVESENLIIWQKDILWAFPKIKIAFCPYKMRWDMRSGR